MEGVCGIRKIPCSRFTIIDLFLASFLLFVTEKAFLAKGHTGLAHIHGEDGIIDNPGEIIHGVWKEVNLCECVCNRRKKRERQSVLRDGLPDHYTDQRHWTSSQVSELSRFVLPWQAAWKLTERNIVKKQILWKFKRLLVKNLNFSFSMTKNRHSTILVLEGNVAWRKKFLFWW